MGKAVRASQTANPNIGVADTPLLSSEYTEGLVSIIIPIFNRAGMVCEALDSLSIQDYSNIELILVDDGSTDQLKDALENWVACNRKMKLQLVHQTNKGAATARNHGMRRSMGEFIYFLDSDDLVLPQSISLLVAALQKARAPYALGRIVNTDISGTMLNDQSLTVWRQSREAILLNQWMTHAALYRRSAIRAIGRYNEALPIGEDTEFHWRMAARNGLGAGIDNIVAYRRSHCFGQLSDLDDVNRTNHTNDVFNSFQKWSLELNLLTPLDRRILRSRHVKNAVQSGASGNWLEKEQSLAMIKQLYPNGFQRILLLGRPKLGPYFFVLKLLISAIEKAAMFRRKIWKRRDMF
tara:strand:+ start:5649 stop:6704 length:1056 start_codon:yes stop_codon:yes gene_type:complete